MSAALAYADAIFGDVARAGGHCCATSDGCTVVKVVTFIKANAAARLITGVEFVWGNWQMSKVSKNAQILPVLLPCTATGGTSYM